jgi:pyruvate,water dikinase
VDAPLVSGFADLPDDAAGIAGGKGASLSRLERAGFPVPTGFVVCAPAFQAFLDVAAGHEFLRARMAEVGAGEERSTAVAARAIREFILNRPLPGVVDDHIRRRYEQLGAAAVAVRSSAVEEDGDRASFAGQHDTFLGVRGADAVAASVRECWASFFTDRALFYRRQKGMLSDVRVAVVVQEMVPADASGVMFTVDPIRKRRDHLVIEAVVGLGEGIVSGAVTPDHHVMDRATGQIVTEVIAAKDVASLAPVLSASDLTRLRDLGLRLEQFFGKPQDVEWSFCSGELFLLQSRPITTL